jgi:hypothetical protein
LVSKGGIVTATAQASCASPPCAGARCHIDYFDEPLQRATLARLESALLPGGVLVIGKSERLPAGAMRLEPWSAPLGVYRLVEEEGTAAGPGHSGAH